MTGTLGQTTLRTGRWELRNTLSSARFAVQNFGGLTVTGEIPIRSAWVDVDANGRPGAVHAELDLAGIDTGNSRRDTDLRKPKLLGTDKFPTLIFEGGPAELGEDGWSVPGRIVAHGAEVAVDLAAVVSECDDSSDLAVSATTEFDRRGLGVRAPRVMIGTQIKVSIDAVFARPS